MVSEVDVNDAMQGCFTGAVDRDCDSCPAHPSAGGSCCHGIKFNEDDNECLCCPHTKTCQELCMVEEAPEEKVFVVKPTKQPEVHQGPKPFVIPPAPAYTKKQTVFQSRPYNMDSRNSWSPKWNETSQSLVKDLLWSGALGMARQMVEFLQSFKWR